MNVLIITAVGGFLTKFLMNDVHMLQDRGHVVHYATNFNYPVYECNRNKLEVQGIRCHQIPIAKSPARVRDNIEALKKLKDIISRENISAVYLHNPMGGVLGRLLTIFNRDLIVIYTAHGFHFFKGASWKNWLFFYPVEKILARRTNILITINSEDKRLAKSMTIRKHGLVEQIPGIGLNRQRFCPNYSDRDSLRSKLGINADDFIFLSVGELNDNKNHVTIIRAFAKISNQNTKLFICGEGKKHQYLAELVHNLKLDHKVILWGYQTAIEEFYQASDCFIFPSIREGLGMASLEAMSCGLPLIAADNRGTREYAYPENSITCKATDTDGFANAMLKVYQDQQLCKVMGENSVKISAQFDMRYTSEVMKRVFERMSEHFDKEES